MRNLIQTLYADWYSSLSPQMRFCLYVLDQAELKERLKNESKTTKSTTDCSD